MTRKQKPVQQTRERPAPKERIFHLEFKNATQNLAWSSFQQHDILFLLGPAGVGKSLLASAFAINEVLAHRKKRIVLTRPVVEAGESLGFLPGTMDEKMAPYMAPIFDCLTKLAGGGGSRLREMINSCIEVAPLAYLRGRTFDDSVCVFDEAQNATYGQLKLYLSRLGENSKMIVNGDPSQSDLLGPVALVDVVDRLRDLDGIGTVDFQNDSIVRHPLIGEMLKRL